MKKIIQFLYSFIPCVVFLFILLAIPVFLFAQDSVATDTTVTGGGTTGTIDKLIGSAVFWITAVLVILEAVFRAIPTSKNWAPLTGILSILQKILSILGPNKVSDSKEIVTKQIIVPRK